MQTKYAILDVLNRYGIPYAQKGKSFVTRCPFCKGDGKINDHNAEVNPESGTIYCFSEQRTYFIKDLLQLFGEITEEVIERKRQEMFKSAQHNTALSRVTRERHKFDVVKSDLLAKGYTVTGIYSYFDLQGTKQYEVIRFEKPQPDGKPEKKPIPVDTDGFVGLANGKRQIPYRLEQFLLMKSDEIWLVEGEKCCDAVIASMPSSANIICLGFRKASDFKGYENLFKNKKVVVFEDNDKTGATNTQNLVEMLKPFARGITVVKFSEFRESYDVADFLQDFSWNQLLERIEISETITTPASQMSVIKIGTIEKVQKQEEWILEPFVPTNSIVMIDGLGGTGKSIFAMEMAFAVSVGQSFLMKNITPTGKYPILYMTAEETDWRFYERLQAIENAYQAKSINFYWLSTMSKDFTYQTRLFCKEYNTIEPTGTFDFLWRSIEKTKAKIVVLDSWINFYGIDENNTEYGATAYDYLKCIIKACDCSFLVVHHQTKEAMRGQIGIFRGSGVFREQARTRIVMTKKHEQRIVEVEKSNYYSELLTKFPISIELHNGVWTVTGQKVAIDGENGNGKKKNGNGNGNRNIHTHSILNENF